MIPAPIQIGSNVVEWQPTPRLRWLAVVGYSTELQQWYEASAETFGGCRQTHGCWVTVPTEN